MPLAFKLFCPPQVVFGATQRQGLGAIVRAYGRRAALVTGGSSLERTGERARLLGLLDKADVRVSLTTVQREPSPEMVDSAVRQLAPERIEVVVAIGGGSVIDAGKAIAAMLPIGGSVAEYLEGVGTKEHPGTTLPLVAVPTTAGTGSEATKNAVLSSTGAGGFKASLRHDRFVPACALIDPELHLTCPPALTAACGLDAFTQLLEGFVSVKATPLTDALAWTGLEHAASALVDVATTHAGDIEARSDMAYAAFLSGVVLAHAGLGVVHGLASVLGGLTSIPHGVACGTMLATATDITIERLHLQGSNGAPALEKYARVGRLIGGRSDIDRDSACRLLVDTLAAWAEQLDMPMLGVFGITATQVPSIASQAGPKNNPGHITAEAMARMLKRRL